MPMNPGKPASEAPGPPGLPLVGSAPDLLKDILGTSLRGMHDYGNVVRYLAGPPGRFRVTAYGICHPDDVQHVLAAGANRYAKQDSAYIQLRALVGNGLLTSEGETWKRQKRLVQPLFTHNRVNGYAAMMAQEAAELIERWESMRRKDATVDLHSEMTRFSLRVVCRALFGTEVEHIIPVLRDNVPYLSRRAFRRSLAPIPIPAHWPTPGNKHARQAQAQVRGIVDEMISDRRMRPAGNDDLLSLLLRAQDPEGGTALSDEEVRDQALIFLLAGHETTATSLTFTFHLLGRHPDVQRKVRKEVLDLLAGGSPDLEDVKGLSYTTMAIKEAMRLYPAAHSIPRLVIETDRLGGYEIPAGSVAVLSPWVTHRHPEFWEDPDRYDPERFTPAREKTRHRYAYFPFGGGPRACIGQYFSMLEAVIVTAMLVRAYELTSPEGPVKLFTGITLRPKQAMPCRIDPVPVTAEALPG